MKLKRYHRKKEFKFSELLKFLRKNENSESKQKQQQAEELLATIRPQLQSKIEKLLTDKVEKLVSTVERQNLKIKRITDVLNLINSTNSAMMRGKGKLINPT